MKTLPTTVAAETGEVLPLSIRILRLAQPLIAAILRSRLNWPLSRDVLLLTYRGRKSGATYSLPLSYVEVDGHLYLCTRTSRWWRNLGEGRRVELALRGRRVEAATFVLDSSSPEALLGFRTFVTHNPKTGEMLYEVGRDERGKPLAADIEREVHRSVVLRVEPLGG